MEHQTGLEEAYVIKENKRLRMGYTTGSCAAAAAKAAAQMLLSGRQVEEAALMTPKGILLHLLIEEIHMAYDVSGSVTEVRCAVRKDGGDDPDVTHGALIFATVSRQEQGITIDGGKGVGRVTKPGLAQPVGEAAINPVPRRMILEETRKVCESHEYTGGLKVIISIPKGEELAGKTFNPRLGIVGGISVLGTSGIVVPMSEDALIASIRLEMQMLVTGGARYLLITPGNYGAAFAAGMPKLKRSAEMKCSNYVGEAIEDARLLGMKGILLIGHVGKWVKLAAGVMNTHSRQADCRMEVLAVHAAMQGADRESVCRIMQCLNTTEALKIIRQLGILEPVMASVMDRIDFYLSGRAGGEFEIGAIMFSNEDGILGKTPNAEQLLERIQNERKQK